MRKIWSKIFGTATLAFMLCLTGLVMPPSKALADCPDMVLCLKSGVKSKLPDTDRPIEIGRIFDVPTCYQFLQGCKPWHCRNTPTSNTNDDYWKYQCMTKFPEEFTSECIASKNCYVSFPLSIGL